MKLNLSLIQRMGALAVASALMAQASVTQAGDPLLQLLEVLRSRGNITETEYKELRESAETQESMQFKSLEQRLLEESGKVRQLNDDVTSQKAMTQKLSESFDAAVGDSVDKKLDGKWFNNLKLSGYTQLRYTSMLDNDGAVLNVPNDGSAAEQESFRLRRGRIKFSGDVAPRLYLYAQMDLAASAGRNGSFALQMRDLYGDLALTEDKEYRLRFGQSKVPFGFVNLQSSQNRPTLERADAINSAAENERDIGAFLYWAPTEIRKRFKELKKLGLKGSGDYGLVGLGVYNGQGPNRNDNSGNVHTVARVTYPFKLDSGQFVEVGVQGYHGQYRVSTSDPDGAGALGAPIAATDGTVDQRAGLSLIYYPQPWGFEAEWNVGRGPTLTPDFTQVKSEFLHGGYLMTYYQTDTAVGRLFPFARWNYYDGGRKFGTNAPEEIVNEIDFGFEWSPWPYTELSIQYTKTLERSNTRTFPYDSTTNADRIGIQLQINY
jgi:hypothetical protein